MGFGIILVGILFLLGVEAGFGVIGYLLIAYGCVKLSRIHDDFLLCGILSLLNLPYTLVSGLTMFGVFPEGNVVCNCLNVAHYVFSAAMFWIFCIRIRKIARLGEDEKLASAALRNGLMAVMYFLWIFAALLIPAIRNTTVLGILTLFKYAIILLGVMFLLSCGAKITTPSQMEKELRQENKPAKTKKK